MKNSTILIDGKEWKLVPIDPSDNQVAIGYFTRTLTGNSEPREPVDYVIDVYRRMIGAAPTLPYCQPLRSSQVDNDALAQCIDDLNVIAADSVGGVKPIETHDAIVGVAERLTKIYQANPLVKVGGESLNKAIEAVEALPRYRAAIISDRLGRRVGTTDIKYGDLLYRDAVLAKLREVTGE